MIDKAVDKANDGNEINDIINNPNTTLDTLLKLSSSNQIIKDLLTKDKRNQTKNFNELKNTLFKKINNTSS